MPEILYNTWMEAAPFIVIGFVIAGIMHEWLPPSVMHRHLGVPGRASLLKSVGIGAVVPLCSCGTIPLGIGMYRSGAAAGNMLAFMTSAPLLSPILVIIAWKLLGMKLTLTLVVSALAGSLLLGTIANRLFPSRNPDGNGMDTLQPIYRPQPARSASSGWKKGAAALRWAFLELGAEVSIDILIGLGLAALILSALPMEWISTWLGQQHWPTLLYVILLGIPVYACSIPSIAVIQSLLLLGASPGAAVAYLIAGPATNLGELNAIRKAMGGRKAVFYAGGLIACAFTAGTIADHLLFPDYEYLAFRRQSELVVVQCCAPVLFGDAAGDSLQTAPPPLWHQPFGWLLAAMVSCGAFLRLRHFFMNPCRTCRWRTYTGDGVCHAKCHVRRKYEWLHVRRKQAVRPEQHG